MSAQNVRSVPSRRKKDCTKVSNKHCTILLDPFLSGEVELRQYIVISHADSLFEFETLHNYLVV